MNRSINWYKILQSISVICLLAVIILLLTDHKNATAPFLTAFFISLAIGIRGNENLKGFSYTFWIFSGVTAAMYYPEAFRSAGDLEFKTFIVPLLQIIMFGMGTTMTLDDFKGVAKMPKGVIVGLICQFTIMPVIGLTIAHVFSFPPEIAAGIILVGSSPSGLASNVMAYIGKANLALSITLTACATLLAPILTPALMKFLGGEFVPVNFWNMMISIIEMVIIPIVAGLLFNYTSHGRLKFFQDRQTKVFFKLLAGTVMTILVFFILGMLFQPVLNEELSFAGLFQKNIVLRVFETMVYAGIITFYIPLQLGLIVHHFKKADLVYKMMPLVSMVGIAIIITIITALGRDNLLTIGMALIFACLLHNMSGYFLGYWACRLIGLDEKSCRTISLEVGLQNGGMASALAQVMGKAATVGLAPAVFGPMMNITGSTLAIWWRRKKIKNDLSE